MGAATAQSVIDKAAIILNDTTGVRWTTAELLGWLNEAQLAITRLVPEAYTLSESVALTNGAKQDLRTLTLTQAPIRLVDVVGNTVGASIRKVSARALDAHFPNWRNDTGSATIKHFTFNPKEPDIFYVYPPAATATADIVYVAIPPTIASAAATMPLDDSYTNAMTNYVVFRGISKDAEYGTNDGRARAYLAAFQKDVLGGEASASSTEPATTQE